MQISFEIPGPPQGKARPRIVRTKSGNSVGFTVDKTVAYEELVRARYIQAAREKGITKPFETSISMCIYACYPIPKSASKKISEAMKAGEILPTKKPDWDNIAKIVCDALNGLAYKDDAQITCGAVYKAYTVGAGHVHVSISEYLAAQEERYQNHISQTNLFLQKEEIGENL